MHDTNSPVPTPAKPSVAAIGKWWICGLLLLALVLNYMDRQTLSLTIKSIKSELSLTAEHYGRLEKGFGYAFAFGGLIAGLLADKMSVRWLYPIVLLGWSMAGVATGYADRIGKFLAPTLGPLLTRVWPDAAVNPESPSDCAFLGFLVCRVVLGLFEAGQWPCALITTQRLLSSADRPLGNSVLQSGASIGAVITPLIIQLMVTSEPGSWRSPYVVIGCIGLGWLAPWFWMTRRMDLGPRTDAANSVAGGAAAPATTSLGQFWRRYAALVFVVVSINLPWHFFRAWLPLMLEEFHKYEAASVRYFTAAYYIATDVGCLTAGLTIKWLITRGRSVEYSRLVTFFAFAVLTSCSTLAAYQGRSPLLLGLLLLIGFGALGLFPIYYSLTQELSTRHQGKVTGSLSFITWVVSAEMQERVGKHVTLTKSYADGIFWVGLVPLVGFTALLLLWGRDRSQPANESPAER